MLLKRLIDNGVAMLSDLYPGREALEIVYACLESFIGTQRHTHIVYPEFEVTEDNVNLVMSKFERLAAGEPLQYVTGVAYFYGREFHVTPATLIPRPETELLCRMAVEAAVKPSSRILDLCTGSGCIAWTMALELPKSQVSAVDISEGALAVASSQDFAEEIQRTGANAPTFIKADILSPFHVMSLVPSVMSSEVETSSPQKFDLILSNPPYVMDKEKSLMRSNVLDYEPHLALFVSDADPLVFYRAVADRAVELLAPEGVGIVEINEALGEETAEVFRSRGFLKAEVVKDLYEKDRFVRFAWK